LCGGRVVLAVCAGGFWRRWVAEHCDFEPLRQFCDVQAQSPYRLWHYTHRFQPVDGGTLMRDLVRYALPFGLLGRFAHGWLVKSDLKASFDYRAGKVSDILGAWRAHE
jgi:ligand-binding SRPBCC domain-containing protein